MEQFLTGDIWRAVNRILKKKQKKIACIAYVTSDNLHLTKGDVLICDASQYSIKFGETSARTIDSYFKRGVRIYSNQNLHSKLLLTDRFLVIGSANLSRSSAERLTESSVVTNNEILISQTKAFCHNLIEESDQLTSKEIGSLLKIKVVKRPVKPSNKSKLRTKKFGSRIWVLPISDIKKRISDAEIEFVEDAESELKNEYISYIRMKGKSSFRSMAKEGDQFIKIWTNDSKSRRYIYPLNTVLLVQRNKNWTRYYYDETKTEGKKTAWSKFLSIIDRLGLERNISKFSFREISNSDAKKLSTIFK
jgi:hypothetical protein